MTVPYTEVLPRARPVVSAVVAVVSWHMFQIGSGWPTRLLCSMTDHCVSRLVSLWPLFDTEV
jgi:hypothetical protein